MRNIRVEVYDDYGKVEVIERNDSILFVLESLGAEFTSLVATNKTWIFDPRITTGMYKEMVFLVASKDEEAVETFLKIVSSLDKKVKYEWLNE